MDVEFLRDYALSFKGVTESFPFDEHTLVFKVMNKIFIMVSLERQPQRFNFKADPEDCMAYREKYPAVIPGYYSHKKYWNTVSLDGSVPQEELMQWVSDSYNMVVASLPKYVQKQLAES